MKTYEVKQIKIEPVLQAVTDSIIKVTLKVFWKHTRLWNQEEIERYHKLAPFFCKQIAEEKKKFTCEDFAIRVLCEFASFRQLPVRLVTGARVCSNIMPYMTAEQKELLLLAEQSKWPLPADELEQYSSTVNGFCDMVMQVYGARDMQKVGVNTVNVATPEDLLPGDILAHVKLGNSVATHIQVVTSVAKNKIGIHQGNSGALNIIPFASRILNAADPRDDDYTGQPIERGVYNRVAYDRWDYDKLLITGEDHKDDRKKDFMKQMQLYRWNFMGFNQ
jgi:hypothetical protein